MSQRPTIGLGLAACIALLSSGAGAADGPLVEAQKLFDAAIQQRERGELDQSIRLYQEILGQQPALSRARAELALTYYQALNFAAAREEARMLLGEQSLPANVRANLDLLIERIDRESRPHRWQPFMQTGIGHDSNANVGPGADTVQAGGALLTLLPGATRQADTFTQFSAGISHRYLAPQTLGIGGRTAAFLWQSSASYFTQNYRSLTRFDLDVLSLASGPSLIVAGRARASLNAQYDQISIGHTRLAIYSGVSPNLTLILGRTELGLDAQVQQRRFTDIANAGRNSRYQSLGLAATQRLTGNLESVEFLVGARLFDENADLARHGNRGSEIYLGAGWKPWQGGQVFARTGLRKPRYKDVEPLFNEVRADRETRTTIGSSHAFQSGWAQEFTLSLSASFTRNRSTVPIYEYHRDQLTVSFGRAF